MSETDAAEPCDRRPRWRLLLSLTAIVLVIAILPVALLGFDFENRLALFVEETVDRSTFAVATIALLAADVFLPVPSSLVSTLAGSRLGIVAATVVSWLGMTLGALLAFALARFVGRSMVVRFAQADDTARLQQLAERRGGYLLVLTRPLPVLAEAAVLLLGTVNLSWQRFLVAVALSNLGLALAYSTLGYFAYRGGVLTIALAASVALPLLATLLARRFWPAER